MSAAVDLHRPRLTVPVSERDHVIGPETAPVTMVEYGDYECPYCGAAHPSVKAVQGALGDKLRFAFRHFPLSSIHLHALPAAEAAEAAGAQGAFWGMHDLLFATQQSLEPEHLLVTRTRSVSTSSGSRRSCGRTSTSRVSGRTSRAVSAAA
jgi:protein-disulfide isomerase